MFFGVTYNRIHLSATETDMYHRKVGPPVVFDGVFTCLAEERIRRARNRIAAVVLGDDGVSTGRQDEELRDRSDRHPLLPARFLDTAACGVSLFLSALPLRFKSKASRL